ncbi:polysaccharide lyase 8 family protein [Oceanivirga salmonicida]|uniref:polysaccharide lyase 8 family protein n=1 Tax=Oceanivirga salmonicida TaxID=1769291 RepID=UPI0012E15BEE|nr:polysaccharide lyase 8 family protein [Oceanivirga salmonicida]
MKKIFIYITIIFSLISFGAKNDQDKMRLRFKEFLLNVPQGQNLKVVSEKDKKENIVNTETKAKKAIELLAIDKTDKYIFNNLKDLTNGKQVRTSLIYIENIAKAYETPGTVYYKREDIKNIIIKSLEIFAEEAYYYNGEENGNWWFWEIGIPKTLNETLVIAYDIVPLNLRNKLLKASKYFQPDPRYSGLSPAAIYSTSTDKRISEGGNRIDTAFVSLVRGILSNDEKEIKLAINSVDPVVELTEKGNGLYADGSFIQHSTVPANGSYGAVLLNGISLFMYLTGDTDYEMKNPAINNLYKSILDGYAYLLINGGINDSVRGRGISREGETDLNRAIFMAEAISLISNGANEEYRNDLKALVKKIVKENNSYDSTTKMKNYTKKSIILDILKDNKIGNLKLNNVKIFGAMDRAVWLGKNDGKVLIAMHSNRIANYETMNGENLKGWHTGDGMTYIYTKDSSSFSDFWPTVNMLKLPGTTESKNERIDKSGERRVFSKLTPKKWVGGSTNKTFGFVGMDFNSYNDKTKAKKSWLLLDDAVLALGSGINSTDGMINTIVENRKINENDKVYLNNKVIITNENSKEKLNYIIYKNNKTKENIGYIVFDNDDMNVNILDRTGSFKNIGGKSETQISKKYLEVIIEHGKNPKNSKYSYLILPNMDEKEILNYNLNDIKILKQDDDAHIVYVNSKKLLAINSFKKQSIEVEGIKIEDAISLIKVENKNGMSIAVSDPTHDIQKEIEIEIDGKYKLKENTLKDISLINKNSKTIITLKLDKIGGSKIIDLVK